MTTTAQSNHPPLRAEVVGRLMLAMGWNAKKMQGHFRVGPQELAKWWAGIFPQAPSPLRKHLDQWYAQGLDAHVHVRETFAEILELGLETPVPHAPVEAAQPDAEAINGIDLEEALPHPEAAKTHRSEWPALWPHERIRRFFDLLGRKTTIEKLNISKETYDKWRKGARAPGPDLGPKLEALARAEGFEQPPEWTPQRIRELRFAEGLSNKAMAKALECSSSLLSRIERGRTKPTPAIKETLGARWRLLNAQAPALSAPADLDRITVGYALRKVLLYTGWSSGELSTQLGVPSSTASGWSQGNSLPDPPNYSKIKQLCSKYNVKLIIDKEAQIKPLPAEPVAAKKKTGFDELSPEVQEQIVEMAQKLNYNDVDDFLAHLSRGRK